MKNRNKGKGKDKGNLNTYIASIYKTDKKNRRDSESATTLIDEVDFYTQPQRKPKLEEKVYTQIYSPIDGTGEQEAKSESEKSDVPSGIAGSMESSSTGEVAGASLPESNKSEEDSVADKDDTTADVGYRGMVINSRGHRGCELF